MSPRILRRPEPSAASALTRLFDDGAPDLRTRLLVIYAGLAALNLGAWLWALAAFHDRSALLGVALVV